MELGKANLIPGQDCKITKPIDIAFLAIQNNLYAAEAGMPQLDPKYWASQAFWLILVFTILYISFCFLIVFKLKSLGILLNPNFSKNLLIYISFMQSFRILTCIFPIILFYFLYLHKHFKVILLSIFIFFSAINFTALVSLKTSKLDNFFESFTFFLSKPFLKITAAAYTGPIRLPLPTSSTPAKFF